VPVYRIVIYKVKKENGLISFRVILTQYMHDTNTPQGRQTIPTGPLTHVGIIFRFHSVKIVPTYTF